MEMTTLLEQVSNSQTTLTIIALCLSIILFILSSSSSSSNKKQLWPPSPPGLPVIGNLHQLGAHPERSLRSLSDKHGSAGGGLMLLRLGRVPTLVVSSPEAVREIAKRHDAAFSGRHVSRATDAIYFGSNDIVFAQCGQFWRRARKLCVLELLSPWRVRSFHPVRAEEVSSLVANLRRSAGEAVDVCDLLVSASNDVISRCIFGQRYSGEKRRIGGVVRRVMVQLMAFCVGDYFPALRWVDAARGFARELRSSVEDLDAFYSQVLEERERSGNGNGNGGGENEAKDFVDILLELQKSNEVGLDFTTDHLKAILQDMFFGGIETTSTISEWLMAELVRKPALMKKAQEEVRRVVGQKAKVEPSDLDKMDYFKCVMKETLRLHPPAPLLVPRRTTEAVKIGGYEIPEGTRVLVNAWAVQRHPGSWAEPEEFVPERFENSPIDYKGQDYFQFIPFGFGRRRCPAIEFGMVGAEFMAANLLYWFDWKLPNEDEDLDMSEVYGIAVHKKVPLRLIPIPYSPSSSS